MGNMGLSFRCIAVLMGLAGALLGCPGAGPPQLSVRPTVLAFGASATEEFIAVTNPGGGTLEWTVECDVPWLSVSPSSGATSAFETARVRLTANRAGLAAGTYSDQLRIVSNGGEEIVRASVSAGDGGDPGGDGPTLSVSTTTLTILDTEDAATFTITNAGTGVLAWSVTPVSAEDVSLPVNLGDAVVITPVSASLAEGEASMVRIEVDRDALGVGITEFVARVSSNGGSANVTVRISQGLQPAIGVDTTDEGETSPVSPPVLDFGRDQSVLPIQIMNTGPQGSVLSFTLTTDRPDLIGFTPGNGSSQGRNPQLVDNYDPVPVTAAVFRDNMQGTIDGGVIRVEAPGADPVEIVVRVEAPPLGMEGATNRTRRPFIVRFVFLLRDAIGRAIDTLDPLIMDELQTAFSIEEDGLPLDMDETNAFVTGAEHLRNDLTLMLDYTGSMYAALRKLDPAAGDALQRLYAGEPSDPDDGIAAPFLDGLPPSFSVSLLEYHERQQTQRLIHGFTTNLPSVKAELDRFFVPEGDHGASELFTAIVDACERFVVRDAGAPPLDDADVRALVFITDGRDTSSSITLNEATTAAKDARVRLYPVGFGEKVDGVTLQQLATDSGGHYYIAPDVEALEALFVDDPDLPGTIGRIPYELSRQVVLTYNTLVTKEASYVIRADFRGLEGSFQRDGVFAPGGDVRAGQIALRTNGIQPDGTATVYVRMDYAPRAITQLRMRMWEENGRPLTIERAEGGVLDAPEWFELVDGQPNPIAGSDTLLFLTAESTPLQYASFGNLLKITLGGFPLPDDPGVDLSRTYGFQFRVDNALYAAPPFTKFFQHPFVLPIGYEATQASMTPLLLEDGFDPDAPGAWDRDEDGVPDFDDANLENDLLP